MSSKWSKQQNNEGKTTTTTKTNGKKNEEQSWQATDPVGCTMRLTWRPYEHTFQTPASLYTVISTNVVGSKHEAKRQDRKLKGDFYE